MTLDEFQRLEVGDQVMVHYARRGDQLLWVTVVSQGLFALRRGFTSESGFQASAKLSIPQLTVCTVSRWTRLEPVASILDRAARCRAFAANGVVFSAERRLLCTFESCYLWDIQGKALAFVDGACLDVGPRLPITRVPSTRPSEPRFLSLHGLHWGRCQACGRGSGHPDPWTRCLGTPGSL
jgi:hypothetical protein